MYVNNEIQKKHVVPPTHSELIQMTIEERNTVENVNMPDEIRCVEKGNVFHATAARVHSLNEIRQMYQKVKLQHPEANHIVLAYKLGQYKGCCDDGENFMGDRLLKDLLQNGNIQQSL